MKTFKLLLEIHPRALGVLAVPEDEERGVPSLDVVKIGGASFAKVGEVYVAMSKVLALLPLPSGGP